MKVNVCAVCGTVSGGGTGPRREICSQRCRDRALREGVAGVRTGDCQVCGRRYLVLGSTGPMRRACSRRCNDRLPRSLVGTLGARPPQACDICGESFVPSRSGHRFCSTACRKRSEQGLPCNRRRAYALAAGAFQRVVARREVFERNRWTCQICWEVVDQDARYPDPMSASVDHKVPLVQGGTHELDNLQLAHLGCNRAKGKRRYLPGSPSEALHLAVLERLSA